MSDFNSACEIMKEQLGHDVELSLATGTDNKVSVRTVNGYYKDGNIYVVTHMSTHKMKEIALNYNVAVCRRLFSAQGIGYNLGSPKDNREIADELREVFIAFYDKHINENDPGTCILKIELTNAVVFTEDSKYIINFNNKTAEKISFINDIVYQA